MSYYKQHIFFCTNQRDTGKKCCQQADANAMRLYAKEKLKALGLHGKGGVRVSSSGCMGRCQDGPTVVVYPDAVWYTFHNQQDIDEIIEKHIQDGEVVERLLMLQEE